LNAENITLNEQSNFSFIDNSHLNVDETFLLLENTTIPHLSNMSCKNFYVHEGCNINFELDQLTPNPANGPVISNEITIDGNINNTVSIVFQNPDKYILFTGSEDVSIDYCNFSSSGFHIFTNSGILNDVNISNCNFSNSDFPIKIDKGHVTVEIDNVLLKKLNINTFDEFAVDIKSVNSLVLDSCAITNGENGIRIRQVDNVGVSNTSIDQVDKGISVSEYTILNIEDNYLITFFNPIISFGINLDFSTGSEQNAYIKGNSLVEGDIGIQITNCTNVTLLNNIISNSQDGIIFSEVNDIECISNIISNTEPVKYSGIFLNSSSGNIRNNEISGYNYGIWLANSSPYLARNIIYNNLYNGIYIGEGSSPYMNRFYYQVHGCNNFIYPYSGFNRIYENGGYTDYPNDDGSEIYFFRSNALMDYGCNTIADNREPNPPSLYHTQILLNGSLFSSGIPILLARGNYWGNNPLYGGNDPSERFGDLTVNYEPYLTDPCTTFLESCGWIITDRGGNVIDTLYPAESSGEGSELDMLYSQGGDYFGSNQLNEANAIYYQIVSDYGDDIQSTNAYIKLLNIALLQHQSPEELEQLRSIFIQNSNETSDSLLCYILEQLSRLTLVAKAEYVNAIEQFDDIVMQFPGTEKALYAEIDAYTTALLLNGNGLSKVSKYSLSNSGSFGNKVRNLLQSYLNGEYQSNTLQIPKEYILYQNYPNPFNPSTTIRYAVPKTVNVELKVFDILGREVKTLVNETKNPGYYEVQFNASNFASGVYFYRLKAGDYIKTGKMLLLK
jgi:parallel beta-helix repeat protein